MAPDTDRTTGGRGVVALCLLPVVEDTVSTRPGQKSPLHVEIQASELCSCEVGALEMEPTAFVINGNTDARRTLTGLLASLKVRTKAFASVDEFLTETDSAAVGCLLVELQRPDFSSLAVLEQLRRQDVCLPIIVVSSYADVATVVRAMKSSAINFLDKSCARQLLWEAVQEAFLADARQRTRLYRRRRLRRRLSRLTDGERRVLLLLLDGRTNREIAEELGLSVRTIEVRRSKLMQKMKAQSLAELVRMTLIAHDCEEDFDAG